MAERSCPKSTRDASPANGKWLNTGARRLLQSLEKTEANLKWFDENAGRIPDRRFRMLLRSVKRDKEKESDK